MKAENGRDRTHAGEFELQLEAAYHLILGRSPDHEGRSFFLPKLRGNELSVKELCLNLASSAEFAVRLSDYEQNEPSNGEEAQGDGKSDELISDDFVDVRELLTSLTVEELVASADQYFSRLDSWDAALAKPWYSTHEAPELLATFGALLSGLNLSHGLTVLDFGVGSGWTSWILSQLGCRVIASDVSATALEIARERYARSPLPQAAPQPSFLQFDGHHLRIGDETVDRISVNDAFHHIPNPEEVLGEFIRVLAPGGLCVMSEPGPQHSRLAQSQAEMRNFRVVERDIVLDEVVAQSNSAGFESVEVAVYCGLPHFVSAAAFESAIGSASPVPNEIVRSYLNNRRLLRLRKAGAAVVDSRRRDALGGQFSVEVIEGTIRATVENTGAGMWLQTPGAVGHVRLGAHLYSGDSRLIDFDFMRVSLQPNNLSIAPGTRIEARGELPHLGPGRYRLEFDLVSEGVGWFAENGAPTVTIELSR